MHESDRDMIDKIKKETDDIQIPESLKPENIEAMLREEDEKKKKITKIRKRKNIYRFGSLAAACLVLVSGMWIYKDGAFKKTMTETASLEVTDAVTEETAEAAAEAAEDNEADATANSKAEKSETTVKEGNLDVAKNYEEIYSLIENYQNQYLCYDKEDTGFSISEAFSSIFGGAQTKDQVVYEEAAGEAAADTAATGSTNGASSDYSTTNTREENVDEGDVVKTDGKYLYIMKENSKEIAIADTDYEGKGLKQIGKVRPENVDTVEEIYLAENGEKMILICSTYGDTDEAALVKDAETDDIVTDIYNNRYRTVAITYNLKDHEDPKEIGRVTQSGFYNSSRLVDGYLYLFSNYDVPFGYTHKDQPITYVPEINGKLMDYSDVCIPSYDMACSYMVVSSVDLKNPTGICQSKAIMSQYGSLYVSEKNIYYYETDYSDYESKGQKTIIRSIGYKNGKLTNGYKGTVAGTIDDSFSIDEYKGYLRVITTVYSPKKETTTNEVNVLDQELNIVGRLKDLAQGETVYSARLMGDTGYFVTFRQTDPLFSVDFSDPENPVIIGALKIPGFSEYLHPWGDGKLLGIGMDADEETGITNGLKITMFDISDPSDVKEEATYLLENYYYSEALYSYKSVLASADKNLIGFAAEDNEGTNYLLFSYNDKVGFSMNLEEEVNGYGWFGTRGVYIDRTLYVIRGNVIEAYNLGSYEKVDDLIL